MTESLRTTKTRINWLALDAVEASRSLIKIYSGRRQMQLENEHVAAETNS